MLLVWVVKWCVVESQGAAANVLYQTGWISPGLVVSPFSFCLVFLSQAPRFETLCLLGSTPYLLDLYSDMLLPRPGEGGAAREEGLVTGSQLKEKFINVLFMAARKEPLRYSRYVTHIAAYLVLE